MQIISFSQLADYWACPKLFDFRHLLKLPSPGQLQAERRRGQQIHAQLHLHALGHQPALASDPEQAELWQNYLSAIEAYADSPLWSEWECRIPRQLAQQQIWLYGRMDRLYLQAGKLILLDFKTSGSPSPLSHLQLEFYAWLLWQAKGLLSPEPIEQIEARTLWLDQPLEAGERSFKAADMPALENYFEELLSKMLPAKLEGGFKLPAPRSVAGQPWCTMCEYQRLCLEGRTHA